jgi:serine O-acetyltransferase
MIRMLVMLMNLKLKKFSRFWQAMLGIEIPDPFPDGLILPHPYGVVVHLNSQIGKNCIIYQNVTIGSDKDGNFPTFGSNVVVYAGACIIGGVFVGDDVIIGANAVVNKDVPTGHTAVGVPAKFFPNQL